MERELREFLLRLNAEIRDRALGGTENARPDFKEIVFAEYAGEHLVDVGAIQDIDVCFHEGKLGAGIVKVDGYSIGENDERLDLLTAHFTDDDDPPSITTEQATRFAQRAARLIEAARRKQHADMEPASDARDMMERIHAALPRIVRCRVHIVTNSVAVARAIPDETISGLPISHEIWDIERLFRSMAGGQPREDIEIDFEAAFGSAIPCVAMPANDSDYRSYLAIVPATVLARLYQDYGPRLLEYNVRAFLQATGRVNRGIRDTLRSEPARFMAYNNGISVTVDSLETTQCDGQLAICRVRGLQIVNGAQTTASLHRAGRRDGVDLSLVSVPAKITIVSRDLVDRMVPLISLYANTQNVVQMADFSANEPFVKQDRLRRPRAHKARRARVHLSRPHSPGPS